MSDHRYTLIFTGELLPGNDSAEVQQAFAQFSHKPVEQVTPIFSGQARRLGRQMEKSKAVRLRAKLEQLGMICELRRESAPPPEDGPVPAPVRDISLPANEHEQTERQLMVCPACGLTQPPAQECRQCGVIISKYQAHERPAPRRAFQMWEGREDNLPWPRRLLRLFGLLFLLAVSLALWIGPPLPVPDTLAQTVELPGKLTAMGSAATDSTLVIANGPQLGVWQVLKQSEDRFLRLEKEEIHLPPAEQPITELAVSPRRLLLASNGGADSQVLIWDLPNRRLERRLNLHEAAISRLAFNRDGNYLVSGDRNGRSQLWDTGEFKPAARLPGQLAVSALAFSPDANLIAVGDEGGKLRIWLPSSGEVLQSWQLDYPVSLVAFAPDGNTLAAAVGKKVLILNPRTGAQRHALSTHREPVSAFAFRPDGRMLLVGSSDDTISAWSLLSGRLLKKLYAHFDVYHLAFSADGRLLFSGGSRQQIRVWEAQPRQGLVFPLRLSLSPLTVDYNYTH